LSVVVEISSGGRIAGFGLFALTESTVAACA